MVSREPSAGSEPTVAVVTGASRGVGRGIALGLGEAGAIVYVTGRSVRGQPAVTDAPGTIDETAEEVTKLGCHPEAGPTSVRSHTWASRRPRPGLTLWTGRP
jgi:NAD(P)-dependent dehydrogenase (short-subunit alcohol dehydrogenase family)